MNPPPRKRRRRGRGGGGSGEPQIHLTSQPISRNAYAETRRFLLARHGPVCAYCGKRFSDEVMTLDHVRPHRHGAAQNRRDNLVLACGPCNGRKADRELLAFIFEDRRRAINFVRYGDHLSPLLLEEPRKIAANMGFTIADPDSPYLDVNWKEPTREVSDAELIRAAAAHYAQQDALDDAEEALAEELLQEFVEANPEVPAAQATSDDDDDDVNPYAD